VFTLYPAEQQLIEVPRNDEIKLRHAAIQRRLADLPMPVDRMNGISVILCYKMFGLSNEDIAVATGLQAEQVGSIVMSDAYGTLHKAVVENIQKADTEVIRSLIHENAKAAVQQVSDLLTNGSEGARVALIKDMLDRDGYRPVDVVEHRHKMEGGLRVEIVEKRDNPDISIPVQFNKVIDLEEIVND